MTTSRPSLLRRTIIFGAVLATLAACGRGPGTAPQTVKASAPPMAPAPPSDAPVITLLGDSITAGYGLAAADALPARLQDVLLHDGAPARVRAAGVSGDTTADGLARVDFSVQDDTAVVIVALGGNDLLQGVEPSRIRQNLSAIISRLKARGFTVVLAGMRAPPRYGAYAREFDGVFSSLAKDQGVALYPFLLDGVALDPRLNQGDGIHPNPEGVKIVARRLSPVVIRALRAHRPATAKPA